MPSTHIPGGCAWVPADLYDRARVEMEIQTLRATVHGHVQVIRGMCTDELDHREIDRALVRLDDELAPATNREETADSLMEPWEEVEAKRKAYEAETITRAEIRDALNAAIRDVDIGSDTDDRITSEIRLTIVSALEMVRDKLYDDMRQYR